MVPSPPDLNSEDYLGHLIVWRKDAPQPYIDFSFTDVNRGINAIELSFLNSPTNRISLPDMQLFTVEETVLDTITSTLLDNQDLTQTDNQVRTVTLHTTIPQNGSIFRITFQFTDFHDFDWFFLSEVRFCTELKPFIAFDVMFQTPSTIIQPSADDLRGGTTELVCTVSSQGSYTWQWKKDNSVIGNGDPNYDITIGDGSRTTKLMISNLDFSDAGRYECITTTMNVTATLSHKIHFPGE